jgi:DNA-binding beta-propeller fold protein YncE
VQQLVRGGSDPSKLINGLLFAGMGQGAGLDQLSGGMGLAVDSSGNLYVADAGNDRVLKFAPSAGAAAGQRPGNAATVFGGNGRGAGANQLAAPSGVALDKNGNLYVADTLNHRVQMFAPNANTATTVAGGRGMGAGPKQLSSPRDVAVDANLNIYVADTDNCRVMQWEAKARFGVPIAGGTGGGPAMDQLLSPRAIALSPDGKWIYVADVGNNRIQQWASASS